MRALLDELGQRLGPAAVLTEQSDLANYGTDRSRGTWKAAPLAIALPASANDVQHVVRICGAHGVAIVPSGGRTGLCGGATATRGELVLSLERMRKIDPVDTTGALVRCEAGATVEAVQLAASAAGLMYPVDFAAKGSAQIGGSIATNAGGVKVLRYGSTRAWVSALSVVIASGERLELGGDLVKDNTGYDLRQLFIGAEGTLGIIVGATMRLVRPPTGLTACVCAVEDDASILRLFSRAQRDLTLQAFEYFEHGCLEHVLAHRGRTGGPFAQPSHAYVLIEAEQTDAARVTEWLGEAAAAGEIVDAVVATTTAQARDLWSLREDVSESLHRHHPHKSDISVPIARVPELAAKWRSLVAQALPGAQALSFGHVGDGNLHLNVLPDPAAPPTDAQYEDYDARTYALVASTGGSISAEHGIGLLKRSHLHHRWGHAELAMMRAIKRALDPDGLFNPGKIFDDGAG
jgi:FAD/FMN-containing dehydrogenase